MSYFPMFYFSGRGSNQNFTSSLVTVRFDTSNLDNSMVTESSSGVTINLSGIYEIRASGIVLNTTPTSNNLALTVLQVDTGSGFTSLNGSFSNGRVQSGSPSVRWWCYENSIMTSLNKGDIIRLAAQRVSGTNTLQANGNRDLFIKLIKPL